ncbi:hypothetical protein B5C34_05280 [Pacificimonas flava]|uniref:Integrase catalytic domain-containing protein n=2 Tax=Pacificimonas TaxID=1960290 RepID=A0A219B409_9SPHN|nr:MULTISPECIES: DDE-type integrase/transposase/recombinase [Pacificimonas]MBZ6377368.1 transposase [Pacificimonas aurantium]OWV32924.1 hypothetical protein B5C34_05280 [Pacificimonas flava]
MTVGQPRRKRGRPKGTGYFGRNPDVADFVELILFKHGWSAPRILDLLQVQFEHPPSIQQLRRFIRRLEDKKAAIYASSRDPDLYKSKYRLALGRADGGVDSAHQVWELDTTKADVMTTEGRVAILGLIDRYSRMARFIVADSESGLSVRQLLIDTIEAWGVLPDAVATDNGSGYVNKAVRSALKLLDIEQIICPPGSPEKKPFVERLFGTFMRSRASILPGFTGHSVADAQRLRSRAKKETGRAVIEASLTPQELQQTLSAWVDGTYHHSRHSVLRMTPLAKAGTSRSLPRRAPDAALLQIALTDLVGTRTVGKRGVEYRGGRYWHSELAAFLGRDVTVRRDERDLGELLIFDEDDRFVCRALDHERAGVSEQDFAEAARRHVADHRNREAARIREIGRTFSIDDAVSELRRREIERAENVRTLPTRTRAYDPAFAPPDAEELPPAPPEAEELLAARRPAPETPRPLTPAQKVRDADRIIAAAARGETVDQAELARARLYATGGEYRAEKMLTAHFGPSAASTDRKEAKL